jgi:hypothetical protein
MKTYNYINLPLALAVTSFFAIGQSHAANNSNIDELRKEIRKSNRAYERRILDLEKKLTNIDDSQQISSGQNANRRIFSNDFNPSVGVILNGKYSHFSKNSSEIAGFAIGEEGERGSERFSIDESELNFSSNIDDKFFGHLTAAIVREDGSDKIELEEAYVRTRPELGLPTGLTLKAGRAFWNIGYLNEHHAHADDFADRPLVYRAFLNKSFNDDGAQLSYLLPIDFYTEIGIGSFRGDDFPFGAGDGTGSYSAYLRFGGDIGQNQNWRLGSYYLSGEAKNGRVTNEDTVTFIGDSDLYVADFRYTFAPDGNSRNKEFILQGEYFHRDEDGSYEDTGAATGVVKVDGSSSGWYGQAVYKFNRQWRTGLRYSSLSAADIPAGLVGSVLDSEDHDARSYSAMIDWTNSEFSRVRLQFNHEELSENVHDNQVMLQYVMSFGAHGAHKY